MMHFLFPWSFGDLSSERPISPGGAILLIRCRSSKQRISALSDYIINTVCGKGSQIARLPLQSFSGPNLYKIEVDTKGWDKWMKEYLDTDTRFRQRQQTNAVISSVLRREFFHARGKIKDGKKVKVSIDRTKRASSIDASSNGKAPVISSPFCIAGSWSERTPEQSFTLFHERNKRNFWTET